jgi:glucan phosphorylase
MLSSARHKIASNRTMSDIALRALRTRAGRSILNVARIGRLSSDRAIREYAEDTWRVQPVRIKA